MRSLNAVLLGALIVTAGCTTAPHGGKSPSQTPTPTPAETRPLTASVHPGSTAHLEVRNYALGPVRITVTELGPRGRGVVLNETYTDQTLIEYGDDGTIFRTNGSYRVVISVNGTVQWTKTVTHYESYILQIDSNGSVTVKSHAMA